MQRVLRLTLLFASSMGALDARPHSNYGFYSPYPPPPDQVIYDFAPVQVDGDGRGGHRSTRDSTWRGEFGAFLDGDREPTCEQLREMWHYARSLQERAQRSGRGRGPEREQSSHLPPFVAFSPLEDSRMDQSGEAASSSGAEEPRPKPKPKPKLPAAPAPPRQANRRRMSTPPNTPGRGRPRPRPRPRPPKVAGPAPAANAEAAKPVFGVIKTHAPTSKTAMHVRDPAKEIYSLLKEKALLSSGNSGGGAEHRVFGQVRTHSQPTTRRPSYMSILERELYGSARQDEGDGRDSFGSAKYAPPSGGENDIPPTSSFDKVRAIIAAESDRNDGEAYEGGGPFDLIRERLMNAPTSSSSASSKLTSKDNRAFRRKSSRKTKQRNVSGIRVANSTKLN